MPTEPTATPARDRWSGRAGFILATIGSAVGIGSIWKFPYEVGENGGGVFVLFYVAGLVLVVVPLMLAEFALGRSGGADAATSVANVARRHGRSAGWAWAGTLGAITAFLILSFYAVICGWTLAYAVEAITTGLPAADAGGAKARFDALLAAPGRMFAWHAVVMGATMVVVARGIGSGIERAATILMPILVVLMLVLAGWSIATGDAARTFDYLFRPDMSRFSASVALEALGLGFFSIGVGLGLMITYAAYSDASIDLKEVALAAVVGDTVISLAAGFAVFPLVFAHGLDPAGGAGLVFLTLPLAFAAMPGGAVAAVVFFALLLVAGWSSAISLLEIVVAVTMRRLGWSRIRATLACGLACLAASVPTVLSFNLLSGWRPLAFTGWFANATFFDLVDGVTSNLMLPAGALAVALFAAWMVPWATIAEALRVGVRGGGLLRFALRYVVPLVIGASIVMPLLS